MEISISFFAFSLNSSLIYLCSLPGILSLGPPNPPFSLNKNFMEIKFMFCKIHPFEAYFSSVEYSQMGPCIPHCIPLTRWALCGTLGPADALGFTFYKISLIFAPQDIFLVYPAPPHLQSCPGHPASSAKASAPLSTAHGMLELQLSPSLLSY